MLQGIGLKEIATFYCCKTKKYRKCPALPVNTMYCNNHMTSDDSLSLSLSLSRCARGPVLWPHCCQIFVIKV